MPNPDIRLDTTGQVCPMPAAETRKQIRKMEPGQVLEVTGDFECAAENIKLMAEKNGGQVIGVEMGKNYFKVIVKKV
ncbi:MAG: SirA family protein [Promethearchaeota archaeon CR_4]|nr:MAG: SirA family protein [Candidatus Lokiarchaeota archaeon CR_4]